MTTKDKLINKMLQASNQFQVLGSVHMCKSCQADAPKPDDIKHTNGCLAYRTAASMLEDLRRSNFIPQVENLIPQELVQDYIDELSEAEKQEAEKLANDLFAAATKADRLKLRDRIYAYDNHDVSSPVLQRCIEHGLETKVDRDNFYAFLAYLKTHQGYMDDFVLQAMEMEQERNDMAHLFDQYFPV